MDALQKDWTFTRRLTVDLLDACSKGDLDFALNSHCGPLWKQFRHMGRVHENYLSALILGRSTLILQMVHMRERPQQYILADILKSLKNITSIQLPV